MRAQIDAIRVKRAQADTKTAAKEAAAAPTIFDSILDSDLPEAEKQTERLWEEAQVICIAGTETTAWTLSVLTFYLLSNPDVMRRLRDELEKAMPDPDQHMEIKELEKLPYLVGCGDAETCGP
jgi:cytochrome P450